MWKHYLGPLSAGIFACVLFAAFHASLSAFGGLLVLAVCLNIAYERTGSLLVPIGMHALFNLTSLLVIYGQAQLGAGR
ncbi:MAG: CPBP family intramembrane glutamic endopeptidase [Chthoniobacter sp.]